MSDSDLLILLGFVFLLGAIIGLFIGYRTGRGSIMTREAATAILSDTERNILQAYGTVPEQSQQDLLQIVDVFSGLTSARRNRLVKLVGDMRTAEEVEQQEQLAQLNLLGQQQRRRRS